MLNDVALKNTGDIPSLEDLKKKNPDEFSFLTLNLPNYNIIKLIEYSILVYKNPKYVNGIISNAVEDFCNKLCLQHQTTSLTFDGRENIRRDVLLKLKAIAEYFEIFHSFPCLSTQSIKKGIDTVLGQVDLRTQKKYLNCIKKWIKETKRQELYYDSEINLTGFKQAILKKLDEQD